MWTADRRFYGNVRSTRSGIATRSAIETGSAIATRSRIESWSAIGTRSAVPSQRRLEAPDGEKQCADIQRANRNTHSEEYPETMGAKSPGIWLSADGRTLTA